MVEVGVSDVDNPAGGISTVELYVNGRFIDSIGGPDLTGTQTFTWTTANGGVPYWLDGSHTLTARAFDTSLNEATSAPVSVTVANNLIPIWFNDPAFNSIWSEDMDVEIQVDNLAAESGTHQLLLYVNSNLATTFTVTGSGTFNYTVDTVGPPAIPEGTADLIAILRDMSTNEYETTALDFIVDHTPPNINIGSPFDLPWINKAEFPLNVQATITDNRVLPADPNDVDDATVTAQFSGDCASGLLPMSENPPGSDTYTLSWISPSCENNVEGVLTITVEAYDVASPANFTSRAFTTGIDTKKPTVDTLTVIPMVNQSFTMGSTTFDGFIKGDVTLQATVTDAYPDIGAFATLFYNDPFNPTAVPDGTLYNPLEAINQDASSGGFGLLWPTASYEDGIYLLAAGVADLAGNTTDSPPFKVLYLDNGIPSTSLPDVTLPYGKAQGPVPVAAYADANHGFLSAVEHRFVPQGGDPENPLDVKYYEVVNYPASNLQRTTQFSYIMDPSSWGDGFYEGYAYATDWAGNTVRVGPSTAFEVKVRYIDSATAIATFADVSPPANKDFIVTAEGRLMDGAGNGAPGEVIDVEFYRQLWNICQDPPACTMKGYEFTESGGVPLVSTTQTTTDPTGYILPVSSPASSTTWEYQDTDRALVVLIDQDTGAWYGYIEAYLSDPEPVGVLNPWDQFFRQRVLFTALDYSSVPYTPSDNEFTVSGSLVLQDGQPAAGVTVRMNVSWNGGAMNETHEQVIGAGGTFSFDYPAYNLVLPNDTDVYFELRYYFDDSNLSVGLGEVYWLYSTGTWAEFLY